jgi:hypothetical protein
MGPHDAPIIIYGYTPSLVLAGLALVTFLISFVDHIYQTCNYKTWYFLPFAIGAALEAVGYGFRAMSAGTYLGF